MERAIEFNRSSRVLCLSTTLLVGLGQASPLVTYFHEFPARQLTTVG